MLSWFQKFFLRMLVAVLFMVAMFMAAIVLSVSSANSELHFAPASPKVAELECLPNNGVSIDLC